MNLKKISIGFEFGSTRIKTVAIDENHKVIASGEYGWENSFIDGIWTYSLDEVKIGMQTCFAALMKDFKLKTNLDLSTCGSLGISGMMHGYLVLDKNDQVLAPFRTWRNTITEVAATKLSKLFNFQIPQRWSIAHIYESILDHKKEVNQIAFATTLAGYIHYQLTNEKVIGVGEASGMFPIDPKTNSWNQVMINQFNDLVKNDVDWKIENILPKPLLAGINAGTLTKQGALLLDPTGTFKEGCPLVPPEGDMGTGMVATNSVRLNTGNASIGTSSNLTLVTGKVLPPDPKIDIINGPSGNIACLIHVNNGTSDINKWVDLIYEGAMLSGSKITKGELFTKLFNEALKGEIDGGGILQYNTMSGEPILSINEGRMMTLRLPNAKMNLANLMRSTIYSIFGAIRSGIEIVNKQGVKINKVTGHGGFFKTPKVGAYLMSSALAIPITTLYASSEGGPYGMALLASYALEKSNNETLEDYLDKIFMSSEYEEIMAEEKDIEGFNKYYQRFNDCLPTLKQAIVDYKN